MYYWAGSTMPVYPKTPKGPKPKPKPKPGKKKGKAPPPPPPALAPASSPSLAGHRERSSLSEFLEPAVDGPPSPERLRALNKEAKRSSLANRQQSAAAAQPPPSSRELVGRPSWEQTLDGDNLSRKSSGRSASSSMPSRERPESVQIFGKTIFNRRNRIKRESSAQSSSESSLYSAEIPPEQQASKDAIIPGLFNRRRGVKADGVDEAAAAQRRFHISGPYNFQHFTHTQQRERLPSIEQNGLGFDDDDLISSEAPPSNGFGPARLGLRKTQSPPRRLLKHTRSQEQLSIAPPRPPRSPVDPSFGMSPVPPPRLSSRASIRQDEGDALGGTALDRPAASAGLRYGQPQAGIPLHAFSPESDMGMIPEEDRFSHGGGSWSNEANWPLPSESTASSDVSLPLVPEEAEEQHQHQHVVVSRQSRTSLASNNSSLRGSQSVPVLRQLAQSQSHQQQQQAAAAAATQRPMSGASDTLGRFDSLAVQRAAARVAYDMDALSQASWEDDIDYCYEHEVEADCDYAWERPSLELLRDGDGAGEISQQLFIDGDLAEASPALLTPGQFEVPALSPASQASTITKPEAITPTAAAMSGKSNFSLPRTSEPLPQRLPGVHARSESQASTFKESHGFNLSPTLLIPTDFRQQMLSSASDGFVEHEELGFPYDEPTLTMKLQQQHPHPHSRTSGTSASTTGSESERSGLFERHISGTSATTDLTRLTMSTSSLDLEPYNRPDSLIVDDPDLKHVRSSGKSVMPIVPESEESPDRATPLAPPPPPANRRSSCGSGGQGQQPQGQQPQASATGVPGSAADETPLLVAGSVKRRDSLHSRRQRVRASSIPPPPPAGQYSMFPSVKVYGTHI